MPALASNPDVHVRLGMAYARQERLDESQAEFECGAADRSEEFDCETGDRRDCGAAKGDGEVRRGQNADRQSRKAPPKTDSRAFAFFDQ